MWIDGVLCGQVEDFFKKRKQDAELVTVSLTAEIKKEKIDIPEATTSKKTEKDRNKELLILKKFDLNHKFGPCYGKADRCRWSVKMTCVQSYQTVGVERLERWEWARARDLDPPEMVRKLISDNSKDPDYVHG